MTALKAGRWDTKDLPNASADSELTGESHLLTTATDAWHWVPLRGWGSAHGWVILELATQPHFQHPVPSKMGRLCSCPLLPSLPGPACSGKTETLLQQGGTRESALRLSGWGQASKFSAGILDLLGLSIPPSMELRDPRPLFLSTNHCYMSFQIISEPPASFPYVTESVHFRNRLIFFPICSRFSASPSRVLPMPRSSILCQETFHSRAIRSLTVSRNALGTYP